MNFNVPVSINVTNNAPVNHLEITQQLVYQNSNVTFNAANGNLISIYDADANGGLETVTLSVNNGILSLINITGLNLTNVINNANSISLTGSITELNIALNGLKYTPNNGYFGQDVLQITTNDNGNTGQGNNLTTTSAINITVNQLITTPSNQPASFNNLGSMSVNNYIELGSPIYVNNHNLCTISDLNLDLINSGLGDYAGASLTVSRTNLTSTNDVFSLGNLTGAGITKSGSTLIANGHVIANIYNNIEGQLQIEFVNNGSPVTTNMVNSILQSIQYNNLSNNPPTNVSLTYMFNDGYSKK